MIKTAMVSLLALTWVLLSSHCRLEAVPGFEFLRCSMEQSDQGDRCKETGCCAVESSQFQLPRQQDVTPSQPDASIPVENVAPETRVQFVLDAPAPPPPDLPRHWQFLSRSALPPRAPTVAS